MQPLYLICGVSGSGKSWVCRQVADRFHYIPHDEHYQNFVEVIIKTCDVATKPVITECPFGERVVREELERRSIRVIPYFVIELPEIIRLRYYAREKKPLSKAAFTRASSIKDRAREWGAPAGKSDQVLEMLKAIDLEDAHGHSRKNAR